MNLNSPKIIYYYQTFSSLDKLINSNISNTVIYVSSLHFGITSDKQDYIHLNDTSPDSQPELWKNLEYADSKGLTILLMLGGAGGAYTNLFSNYKVYYNLLANLLKKYKYIRGIDLDVEETTKLDSIKLLINNLKQDFGKNFIITMAPVQYAMITDSVGLGGFCYKKLYNSPEGKMISWFNVQAYDSYTYESYSELIKNGYPVDKIVYGMLGDNLDESIFNEILDEILKILEEYKISGVMIWEYGDTNIDPIEWGKKINNIFNK